MSWLDAQRCGERRQETCEDAAAGEPDVVELLGARCEATGEPIACTGHATYLEVGRFVQRDVPKARAMLAEACEAKSGWACNALALSLRRDLETNPQVGGRILELNLAGCEHGFLLSCRDAGSTLLNGEGVERDAPRGLGLVRGACAAGARSACLDLRVMCTVGMGAACEPE